jgi:hypothetical protein
MKDFRGMHIADRFERLLEAHPRGLRSDVFDDPQVIGVSVRGRTF